MTSALVKEIPVQLDRERKMSLTLGDARDFKALTTTEERPRGISLLRGDIADVDLDEDEWIKLFWVCLRRNDRELTEEDLGEIVDLGGFRRLTEAFSGLMDDFLDDDSEAGQEAPADPQSAAP